MSEPTTHPAPTLPTVFLNTAEGYVAPKPVPEDHSKTPPEEYDFNCVIPIKVLSTDKVRLEPYIPSVHGDKVSSFKSVEKSRSNKDECRWAIRDLVSGELAGDIIFQEIKPSFLTLDIGVTIMPAFRRTHVNTHAAWLVLAYALDPVDIGGLGYLRASWWTDGHNEASKAASLRLGMQYEGTLRWYYLLPPPYEGRVAPNGKIGNDAVYYAMTFEDWLQDGKRERLKAMLSR